jgi:hypothetical protein
MPRARTVAVLHPGTPNRMRLHRPAALAALLALAAAACDTRPGDTPAGGALPDTFPVTGTADDLPTGLPMPPAPRDDTLPPRP